MKGHFLKSMIYLLSLSFMISSQCFGLQFQWPLSGSDTPDVFTSEFGPNNHGNGHFYRFHEGMDLQASVGTTVYAAHEGYVYEIGYESNGAGNYITIVDNDGLHKTAYFHLNSVEVQENDPIAIGQLIAYSGETGNCYGPHLHFEYRNPSSNVRLHPLQVMPYTDYCLLGCELTDNYDNNFTVELTTATDELDVDAIELYITYIFEEQEYDEEYLCVYYSGRQNISTTEDDNDIVVLNNHWLMTVTPEYWEAGDDDSYTITYNFQPNPNLEGARASSIFGTIYTAYGIWDGDLDEATLIPSCSTDPGSQIVTTNKIIGCYPNPFSPNTASGRILYSLSNKVDNPQILIYNIRGQKVKTIVLNNQPGSGEVTWDGKNDYGKTIQSGVYFQKLINNNNVADVNKILLLK